MAFSFFSFFYPPAKNKIILRNTVNKSIFFAPPKLCSPAKSTCVPSVCSNLVAAEGGSADHILGASFCCPNFVGGQLHMLSPPATAKLYRLPQRPFHPFRFVTVSSQRGERTREKAREREEEGGVY